MTNAELIKGLRWCADESICCDDFSGEKCPYFDEKKDSCSVDEILHAAADALEAADKRIEELEKRLPKEAHWVAVDNGHGVCSNCNRQDSIDNMATHCRYCGARMTKGKQE